MKTEITIPKKVADTLYATIQEAINAELKFPQKSDEWMDEMNQALEAVGEADRILIEG